MTDVGELAGLPHDDPAPLRGGAVLLRESAGRMVAVVPVWHEGLERLAQTRGEQDADWRRAKVIIWREVGRGELRRVEVVEMPARTTDPEM